MKKFFTLILFIFLSNSFLHGQVEDNQVYTSGRYPLSIYLERKDPNCKYTIDGTYYFRFTEGNESLNDFLVKENYNSWNFNLPPARPTQDGKEDFLLIEFRIESTCPEDSVGYIMTSILQYNTNNYFYKSVTKTNDVERYHPKDKSLHSLYNEVYVKCFTDKTWKRKNKGFQNTDFVKKSTDIFCKELIRRYAELEKIQYVPINLDEERNPLSQVAFRSVYSTDLDINNPKLFVSNLRDIVIDLFEQINFNDKLKKYSIFVNRVKNKVDRNSPYIYSFTLEVK